MMYMVLFVLQCCKLRIILNNGLNNIFSVKDRVIFWKIHIFFNGGMVFVLVCLVYIAIICFQAVRFLSTNSILLEWKKLQRNHYLVMGHSWLFGTAGVKAGSSLPILSSPQPSSKPSCSSHIVVISWLALCGFSDTPAEPILLFTAN